MFFGRVLAVCAIVALGLLAYGVVARPWIMRLGATDDEVQRILPGDGLVAAPDFDATRAVTIHARPEEIYPWLVQWGYGKAGFYGYDLIENMGSPGGIASATRILPELQTLRVGDIVKMTETAYLTVRALEPNRYIVLTGDRDGKPISAMVWQLEPIDANSTRLINRYRFVQMWNDPLLPLTMFTEFGDAVALRKIMLGIQDRVEGRAEPLAYQATEMVLWLLSIIGFFSAVVLMFLRREWQRFWLVGLLAACVFMLVFFGYPPLWLGMLLVLGIFVGLGWAYRNTTPMSGAHRKLSEARHATPGVMRGRPI